MSEESEGIKLMKVKESTHRRLTALGIKTDSYDSIIIKLLDFYDENKDKVKPSK